MSTPSPRRGSCHCGAIRFTVELDLDQPANTCNCSMCGRAGTLLAFVPATALTVDAGEDHLVDYQFNKKVIHHYFCRVCGIKPFARGTGPNGPTAAINLRCLDGVDVFAEVARARQFDGKAL